MLLLALLASCSQPPPLVTSRWQPTAPALTATPTQPVASGVAIAATRIPPTDVYLPTVVIPTPLPTPQPSWRFVVIGDTRTAGLDPPPVTAQIVEHASQEHPHIVLTVGDMINALDDQDSVREQWRRWRSVMAPLGAQTTASPWLLVTPGNHDVQSHAWATDLLVEAFPELPANGPPGFDRRTYRVDYNNVRFISIDSERFNALHQLGDEQLTWLETQLRDNPNRYTIVWSHDPAFPAGPHVGSSLDAYPHDRDRLWVLLKQYHVTAYIAGHEHLYNRSEHDGVTQLIIGASGSYVYQGFGGEFYHYLVGEVTPEGIQVTIHDEQGVIQDQFTLQ
jgi:hypothetical protein